jgi:predicted dehydrogenase
VAALNAGKHVLCEKPFAMNTAEVEIMIQAARDNDRLLVEAVWSRWHPRMIRMVDYVKAGNIGDIVSIESSFTFPASIDENYRAVPAMGGGALFDIGVYPLHAMAALVGDNASVEIEKREVNIGPTGIDLTTTWQMRFNGSVAAHGLASFEMPENQSLIVRGEKESVELLGKEAFTSWHEKSSLRLGEQIEEFEGVDPYRLMVENFGKKLQGQPSWVLPLETSLSVAKMVEQLQFFSAPNAE